MQENSPLLEIWCWIPGSPQLTSPPVFRLLLSLKPSQSHVVVLDEFQYGRLNEGELEDVTSERNAWEIRGPVHSIAGVA